MYIQKVYFENFRAFKEKEFIFGPNLNCISGYNGVGKSTLLAVLSNVGELKKEIGSHINGDSFRGEFSHLIHGDKDFDLTGYNYDVYFEDIPEDDDSHKYVKKLPFRSTFQTITKTKERKRKVDAIIDNKEKKQITIIETYEENNKENFRYRHIPIKNEDRNTESKVKWPTYYLGLSRLYPIGESEEIKSQTNIPNEIFEKIMIAHKEILSSNDNYLETASIQISDTKRKKGFGIRTEVYSERMNSSGQDNLGQILEAVYSFELLKEKMKSTYIGGLLLIDEIDATLHPVAQNKLIDFLYLKSLDLNLQIIFTTHSLSLLEHINKKKRNNKRSSEINTIYLTTKRGKLESIINPETVFLHNDLMNTYSGASRSKKITVYTEDDTARWFFKKIIEHNRLTHNLNLNLIEMSTGWTNIIKLMVNDYGYYRNHLVILDPDLNRPDNKLQLERAIAGTPYTINKKNSNILTLPGSDSIEEIFWNYLSSLEPDDKFFYEPQIEAIGLNINALKENGPFSNEYEHYHSDSIKIKKWFEQNLFIIDISFHYWIEDESYSVEVARFWNRLSNIYNIISNRVQN